MTTRTSGKATSQAHGIAFERLITGSGAFGDAGKEPHNNTDHVDIDKRFDKTFGLDTSVKTTTSGVIGLADAIRFFEIDGTFRLIVGRAVQRSSSLKVVNLVTQYIITTRLLDRIRGTMTLDEIREMHERIAAYPPGPLAAAEARRVAKKLKRDARGRCDLLSLDFKIDDKNQRRLQLSIRQDVIDTNISDRLIVPSSDFVRGPHSTRIRQEFPKEFHNLKLPIDLDSAVRTFNIPDENGVLPFAESETPVATSMRVPEPYTTIGGKIVTPTGMKLSIRKDVRDRAENARIAAASLGSLFG